jgi:hypothetical protein
VHSLSDGVAARPACALGPGAVAWHATLHRCVPMVHEQRPAAAAIPQALSRQGGKVSGLVLTCSSATDEWTLNPAA